MSFIYDEYLQARLNRIIANNVEFEGCKIEISNEQMFANLKILEANTFYIVIKYLSSQLAYNSKTQPLQMLIVSEEDSLNKAKLLFETFANNYNWQLEIDNGNYIKQQYNSPVVLSNFSGIGYGYRSVLYMTGTLYIMEDVLDVNDLKIVINNIEDDVDPIRFSINYGMSGNTQQVAGDYACSTVKSTATVSFSLVVPLINANYIKEAIKVMNGTSNGNLTFKIKFKLGSDNTVYTFDTKLTMCSISTAPNEITGLQLGFMR